MFKKFSRNTLVALAAILLLAACQFPAGGGRLAGRATAAATTQATAGPTLTPTPTATPRPTATPTPTSTPPSGGAVQALEAYFQALETGAYDQAAALLSRFSLSVAALSRGDAQIQMQTLYAAGKPQDLSIADSRLLSPDTALVDVRYTLPGEDGDQTRSETWALRNEEDVWLVNWNGLVDFTTPNLSAQTTAGVTVLPTRVLRYTDRMALEMIVQNRTNEWVYFGQDNEVLATFHFADQTVEAENARIALAPLRSYPAVTLELKGWHASYPETIEIRRWKNYQVDPWYVFDFAE